MDWISFFATGILVYAAVVFFFCGSFYKVVQHLRSSSEPRVGATAPSLSLSGRFFVLSILVAVIGLLLGHTRLFGDVWFTLRIFGEDGLNLIGDMLGTFLGLFSLGAACFLFFYGMRSGRKSALNLSPLLLIITLLALGNYLRLSKPFGLEDYRAYMASLTAFSPSFPESIAVSPSKWIL